MNRNVLWKDPDKVDPKQVDRMNAFWGDETWRGAAYDTKQNLFGFAEKTDNDRVAEAFRKRLKDVAGFAYVPVQFIHRVFDVMNQAFWHRFQVLTKRSDRLLTFSPDLPWASNIWMGVSVENADYTFRLASALAWR